MIWESAPIYPEEAQSSLDVDLYLRFGVSGLNYVGKVPLDDGWIVTRS